MASTVDCGYCGYEIEVLADHRAETIPCPYCHRAMRLPQTSLKSGHQFGDYRIERLLGVGGMGDVYLATQHPIKRKVALKILPAKLTSDREALDRFFNEMRMTAKFEHPNIATAFEAGKVEDFHYLAMAYVDGEDLDVALARETRLPEKKALTITRKVAEALDYAWDKGKVLHRDIKPGNIMLDKAGEVRLMDLGISKSLNEPGSGGMTTAGFVIGTPYYMSPEQARGRNDLDFRSDIYSLGATLYHLLTGSEPFDNDDPLVVMTQHINEPAPSAQIKNPDVSDGCCALLERMLAKSPDDRYVNWQALTKDIDRVIAGEMPPAKKARVAAPGQALVRKNKKKVNALPPITPALAPQQPGRRKSPVPVVVVTMLLLLLIGTLIVGFVKRQATTTSTTTTGNSQAGQQTHDSFIRAAIVRTRQFADANPSAYGEVIQRWRALLVEAGDSPHRALVEQQIGNSQRRQKAARDAVLKHLRAMAEGMADEGNYDTAIAVVRHYSGAFTNQTVQQRDALIRALAAQRDAATAVPDPGPDPGPDPDPFLEFDLEPFPEFDPDPETDPVAEQNAAYMLWRDATVALVADRSFRRLRRKLDQFKTDALSDDTEALALVEEIGKVRELPRRIIAGFRRVKGKETTIRLKNNDELKVIVLAVENDVIKADEIVEYGRVPRELRLTDLAGSELRKRLGRRKDPEVYIMRGLLYLQEGKESSAFKAFDSADTPLAALLTKHVKTEKLEQAEAAARDALLRVLTDFGLRNVDLENIEGVRIRPRQKKPLQRVLKSFFKKHGETEIAGKVRALLQNQNNEPDVDTAPEPDIEQPRQPPIAGPVLVNPNEVDQNKWRRKTADLKIALQQGNRSAHRNIWNNMQFRPTKKGEIGMISMHIDGVADLSALDNLNSLVQVELQAWRQENVKISNLSFLKDKPVRVLVCRRCKLRSLRDLQTLPLHRLDIAENSVSDLSPLRGMHLTDLNVSKNPLRSIAALADMPLQTLRINHTKVDEMSVVKTLPHLQHLEASHSSIHTLKNLNDKKIRHLAVAGTKVGNLEPLLGTALQYLDVSDTEIDVFDALAKLPLQSLIVSDTSYSDIESLRGLPLTTFGANNTGLTSIDALAGKEIHRLLIGGTDISTLDGIAKMPLVELDISNTKITALDLLAGKPLNVLRAAGCRISDISALANCPLRELNIKGSLVKDLSPLRGSSIQTLNISSTSVRDLSPLTTTQLRHLSFEQYNARRDDPILRQIRNFSQINGHWFQR
jgi:hypothetical protein